MDISVIILSVAALLLLAVVLRQSGLWSRVRVSRGDSTKVQLEDALKHIYDCEYNNVACTLESVAGALSLTPDNGAEVISRLGALKLIVHHGREVRLTEAGRDYALRVIRVHRLWERYLADETAVRELDWHTDADKKEHLLTPEETGVLAKRLGHPPFDPHGDPIPTDAGIIPVQQGKPLHEFQKGDTLRVIHVEDEPAAVYAQLVEKKVFPGIAAKVIKRSDEGMELETEGRIVFLSTVAGTNVRAVALDQPEILSAARRNLLSLQSGETGKVLGISGTCRGAQRRRLLDLGIVPGTNVAVEMASASGDPIAYNIRGAMIALRKQQAEMIFIE